MKKRILIIGPVSEALGGKGVAGIARHVEGLALQLNQRGLDVTVWYHKQNKSLNVNGVSIVGDNYILKVFRVLKGLISFLFKRGVRTKGLPLFRVFIISHQYVVLKDMLTTESFDVVHIHSLNSFVGNSLELLRISGVRMPKIVFTDHGFWQNKCVMDCASNPYLKNIRCNVEVANKVIFISDYARDQLNKYRLLQSKFIKIENPILSITSDYGLKREIPTDIKYFIENNTGKKIILFNGYTESISIKRLDLLLDAIEFNCKHTGNCEVVLIAICNDKAKRIISSREWSFDILALGKQPMSVIHYLYDACCCLVNPSISESFGLVYIEALQHGKPIIGFYRVINEFQKKFCVDIGFGFDAVNDSMEVLARLISQLIEREWDFQSLIDGANELTWDNRIHEFITLYEM